jgi:hypothetical protein
MGITAVSAPIKPNGLENNHETNRVRESAEPNVQGASQESAAKEPASQVASNPQESAPQNDQLNEEAKKEIIMSLLGSLTGQTMDPSNISIENTDKKEEPLTSQAIKENINENVVRTEDRVDNTRS